MDEAMTADSAGMGHTPMSGVEGVRPGAVISLGDKSSTAPCDKADKALGATGRRRKPLSFYMAFLCLLIMVFLCSMDSTIMAVSIPVGRTQLDHLGTSKPQKFHKS